MTCMFCTLPHMLYCAALRCAGEEYLRSSKALLLRASLMKHDLIQVGLFVYFFSCACLLRLLCMLPMATNCCGRHAAAAAAPAASVLLSLAHNIPRLSLLSRLPQPTKMLSLAPSTFEQRPSGGGGGGGPGGGPDRPERPDGPSGRHGRHREHR